MPADEIDLDVLWREIDRHSKLLDGDETLGVVGLRDRMDEAERVLREYQTLKIQLRGVLIGLGLNAAGVGAILIKLLGG